MTAQAAQGLMARRDFPADLDAQLRVIDNLHLLLNGGGAPSDVERNQLASEIAQQVSFRLGESIERILEIASLPSRIDRRRALKVRSRRDRTLERSAMERAYPDVGWLGAYLDYTLTTEQPMAWHFWMAALVLGAACRRNVYVDMGFTEPLFLNQFVMIIGPTGRGKNEAMGRATAVLEEANKLVERPSLDLGYDRRVPVLEDVTAEALMKIIAVPRKNKTSEGFRVEQDESIAAVVNAEASTIVGRTKESAERFIHRVTELYTVTPRRTETVGRGSVNLGYGALSLALGSTAEWIIESITGALISGGFTGRCLFISRGDLEGRRLLYQDYEEGQGADPAVRGALARMLVPWMLAPALEAVHSPEAERAWRDWYVEHRSGQTPHPALEGYWQRKPAHIRKLSATLAVSELADPRMQPDALADEVSIPVTLAQLEKATQLINLEEEQLPEVLSNLERHPDTKTVDLVKSKVVELYTKHGEPPTKSQVAQAVRYHTGTSGNFDRILRTLVETEEIAMEPSGRGVRLRPTLERERG